MLFRAEKEARFVSTLVTKKSTLTLKLRAYVTQSSKHGLPTELNQKYTFCSLTTRICSLKLCCHQQYNIRDILLYFTALNIPELFTSINSRLTLKI